MIYCLLILTYTDDDDYHYYHDYEYYHDNLIPLTELYSV